MRQSLKKAGLAVLLTAALVGGGTVTTTTATAAPAGSAVQAKDIRANIAKIAKSQIGVKEKPAGSNCTKYGPCVAWCAYFATWVWKKAGINIPKYGFTGDIYHWGKRKGRAHRSNTGMKVGDIVLYGTGPQNTNTSVHTGVVVAVGKGTITTVEGNSGNKVSKRGPFDPKHAKQAGRPGNIYGWVSAK